MHLGDQAIVEIGEVNKKGVVARSSGDAIVFISEKDVSSDSYTFNATYCIRRYEATYKSIFTHESLSWYNNAKYGIFIQKNNQCETFNHRLNFYR